MLGDCGSSPLSVPSADSTDARRSGVIAGRAALAVFATAGEAALFIGAGVVADRFVPGLLRDGTFEGLAFIALPVMSAGWCVRTANRSGALAEWLLPVAFLFGVLATGRASVAAVAAVAAWFAFAMVSGLLVRRAARALAARLAADDSHLRTVAFIGNSTAAATMVRQLEAGQPRVRIAGYFDDRLTRPGPLVGIVPCLGTVDDLVAYIHDATVDEVYMALPWSAGPRISQLVERLRFLPLTVRLLPDHLPPALPGRGDGQMHGVVMPTLVVPPFSRAGALLKRVCDLVVAGILLVPLLPLFGGIGLCLRLDSRGPIFFRQVRSGQYGRPFRIFKFRTLHVAQADDTAETLVTSGDRRVTRVGRVLRKYSIDELPQVFNVLLGHMSLVGPRPHAPKAKADGRIYAEVMPEYMLRYRVKPGMTGWAQVNGWRGNTDTEEQLRKRVEFDFQYIGGWSALSDVKIMLRTIPAMMMPPTRNV